MALSDDLTGEGGYTGETSEGAGYSGYSDPSTATTSSSESTYVDDSGAGGEGGYSGETSDGAGYSGYSEPPPDMSSVYDPPPAPDYDGPTIRPSTEDDERGVQAYKDQEERERAIREFLGEHDDPHTHGETDPGEPPEPNLPTAVE